MSDLMTYCVLISDAVSRLLAKVNCIVGKTTSSRRCLYIIYEYVAMMNFSETQQFFTASSIVVEKEEEYHTSDWLSLCSECLVHKCGRALMRVCCVEMWLIKIACRYNTCNLQLSDRK